jgi:hypothetical protein
MIGSSSYAIYISLSACASFGAIIAAIVFTDAFALMTSGCIFFAVILIWSRDRVLLAVGTGALASAFLTSVVWLVISGNWDSRSALGVFIIGETDSLLYHSFASFVSQNVPLYDQLKIWDLGYLRDYQYSVGMEFAHLGFFWLLGIFYTLVGNQDGPYMLMIANPLLMSSAIALSTRVIIKDCAWRAESSLILSSFVICLMFFSSNIVLPTIISCRKDTVVAFLICLTLSMYANRKLFRSTLTAIVASLFRFGYVFVFIGVLLVNPPWLKRVHFKKPALFLGLISIFFSPAIAYLYMQTFGDLLELDDAMAASLTRSLGGSEAFVNHWWLNWIYVLAAPFPPAQIAAYVTIGDGFWTLTTFASTVVLLMLFLSSVRSVARSRTFREPRYDFVIAVFLFYASFSFSVAEANYHNLVGEAEPRYKLVVWLVQVCLGIRCLVEFVDSNRRGTAPGAAMAVRGWIKVRSVGNPLVRLSPKSSWLRAEA